MPTQYTLSLYLLSESCDNYLFLLKEKTKKEIKTFLQEQFREELAYIDYIMVETNNKKDNKKLKDFIWKIIESEERED